MIGCSYSGTHEDYEKIAKTRDVTQNYCNTFYNRRKPALSESELCDYFVNQQVVEFVTVTNWAYGLKDTYDGVLH